MLKRKIRNKNQTKVPKPPVLPHVIVLSTSDIFPSHLEEEVHPGSPWSNLLWNSFSWKQAKHLWALCDLHNKAANLYCSLEYGTQNTRMHSWQCFISYSSLCSFVEGMNQLLIGVAAMLNSIKSFFSLYFIQCTYHLKLVTIKVEGSNYIHILCHGSTFPFLEIK